MDPKFRCQNVLNNGSQCPGDTRFALTHSVYCTSFAKATEAEKARGLDLSSRPLSN